MLNEFKSHLNITSFCRIIAIPNIIIFEQQQPPHRHIHSKCISILLCLSLGNTPKKGYPGSCNASLPSQLCFKVKLLSCCWFQQEIRSLFADLWFLGLPHVSQLLPGSSLNVLHSKKIQLLSETPQNMKGGAQSRQLSTDTSGH